MQFNKYTHTHAQTVTGTGTGSEAEKGKGKGLLNDNGEERGEEEKFCIHLIKEEAEYKTRH